MAKRKILEELLKNFDDIFSKVFNENELTSEEDKKLKEFINQLSESQIKYLLGMVKSTDAGIVLYYLGYERLKGHETDLLELLQDLNWSINHFVIRLLKETGEPLIPYIREIFKQHGGNEDWVLSILGCIVDFWPNEIVTQFKEDIINEVPYFEAIEILINKQILSKEELVNLVQEKEFFISNYLKIIETNTNNEVTQILVKTLLAIGKPIIPTIKKRLWPLVSFHDINYFSKENLIKSFNLIKHLLVELPTELLIEIKDILIMIPNNWCYYGNEINSFFISHAHFIGINYEVTKILIENKLFEREVLQDTIKHNKNAYLALEKQSKLLFAKFDEIEKEIF